jgi:hypothetical protein
MIPLNATEYKWCDTRRVPQRSSRKETSDPNKSAFKVIQHTITSSDDQERIRRPLRLGGWADSGAGGLGLIR